MSLQDEIKAMFQNEEAALDESQKDDTTTSAEVTEEDSQKDTGNEEVPVSEEEDESLETRYSKLLESYNEASARLSEAEQRSSVVKEIPSEVPPQKVEAPVSIPSEFQVDEKLLERALIEDDPVAMKQVLMSIVNSVTSQREVWRESILRDLPLITRDVARQQVVLMRAVDKFYQDNSDLIPYQGVVGNITNQVSAAHPEYSLGQLFEEVEKNVRKTLGLKKIAQRKESANDQTPAFVKGTNARKPGVPKLEGLRGEIAAMKAAKY